MRASVAVAVVCVVASTAAASGQFAVSGARADGATAAQQRDRIWQDARARLTVRYPARWHVTTRNLTNITQPVPRFAIYSGATPRPVAVASGDPRANQVIGIVMESTPVSAAELRRLPPRPHRFTVNRLTGVEGFGNRWIEFFFRDHGREFYVFIGVGKHAARQLPTLLRSLDTFRVGG